MTTCTTQNTITTGDIDGLNKDIDTISEVVESTDLTAETKNGRTIDTLTGRLLKLGYMVPVPYEAGIVFSETDNTKTVERDGIIYAPYPGSLPFTTSGTWLGDDDAHFYPIQGQLYANTVSDLRAIPPGSATYVNVLGHTRISDGGGDVFVENTDGQYVDNNWSTIVPDGGDGSMAWLRDYDGVAYPEMWGAVGDGVADDTEAVQAMMDSTAKHLRFSRAYAVTGVTLKRPAHLEMTIEGKLVAHSSTPAGNWILTITGYDADPADLSEYCIKVSASMINLDAQDRGVYDVGGLMLRRVMRTTFGHIYVRHCRRGAMDVSDVVKECVVDSIRTWMCGDLSETISYPTISAIPTTLDSPPNGTTNNIAFNAVHLEYSYGYDIHLDSGEGRGAAGFSIPRHFQFHNLFIHGPIDYANHQPPLTEYQEKQRKQIVLGHCDRVQFGMGICRFPGDEALRVHVTTGIDSSPAEPQPWETPYPWIEFNGIDFSGRFHSNDPLIQGPGVLVEKGLIIWNNNRLGSGSTDELAFECLAGVETHWSLVGNEVTAGNMISIADETVETFRKQAVNFGAMNGTNLKSISGAAAVESLVMSARSQDALVEKNTCKHRMLTASNKGEVNIPESGMLTFEAKTLPTAANMIADGVDQSIGATGANLRHFNGTEWSYIPRADGNSGGAGSAGAGNQFVRIEVNGVVYKVLHDGPI